VVQFQPSRTHRSQSRHSACLITYAGFTTRDWSWPLWPSRRIYCESDDNWESNRREVFTSKLFTKWFPGRMTKKLVEENINILAEAVMNADALTVAVSSREDWGSRIISDALKYMAELRKKERSFQSPWLTLILKDSLKNHCGVN